MKRKSIITSISSYELSYPEKNLLKTMKPWGIILFKRNIKNFDQLKKLTTQIRKTLEDPYYPILIDEEGGRVSRLSKILNTEDFSQQFFRELYNKNKFLGTNSYKEYLHFNCQLLSESGININTIPVLDIFKKNAHKIIGDRLFKKFKDYKFTC